jgi:hypothetical protein
MLQNFSSENPARKPSVRAVFMLGLLVGTLDITGAIINYVIATGGKNPIAIFRYIASALFDSSLPALFLAVMGLIMHYVIALGWTALFFFIYPRLRFLRQSQIATGMLYGIFVWIVMTLVFLPLTRIPPLPVRPMQAAIGIGILIVAIGLPLSFFTHHYYFGKSDAYRQQV